MPLGTNEFTTITHATWIPEVWLDELRAFREKNLVFRNLVKTVPFEGSAGDVIHVPDLSRLTVNNVTDGDEVTLSTVTESEFTGTVTRHRAVSFQVPKKVALQAKYMVQSAYMQSAGKSIAEDLDQHIWSLESGFQGGTRYLGTGGAYSMGTGADIDDAGLRAHIERLDVADVPMDARFLVAAPPQKNVMLGINRFVEYQSIGAGNMPIRTGLFGEIYGIPVYFSTNEPGAIMGADTNLLGQEDAILLAMQDDISIDTQWYLKNLSWLVVCDYIGQAFEFRDDHAISIVTPA